MFDNIAKFPSSIISKMYKDAYIRLNVDLQTYST